MRFDILSFYMIITIIPCSGGLNAANPSPIRLIKLKQTKFPPYPFEATHFLCNFGVEFQICIKNGYQLISSSHHRRHHQRSLSVLFCHLCHRSTSVRKEHASKASFPRCSQIQFKRCQCPRVCRARPHSLSSSARP